MAQGRLTFVVEGQKLRGEFALIRFKGRSARYGSNDRAWLLVKKRDEHSSIWDVLKEDTSVKTGRSMHEIAAVFEKKGDIWVTKSKV
jgi:bifunctional non-homologous end joining protein LigD